MPLFVLTAVGGPPAAVLTVGRPAVVLTVGPPAMVLAVRPPVMVFAMPTTQILMHVCLIHVPCVSTCALHV